MITGSRARGFKVVATALVSAVSAGLPPAYPQFAVDQLDSGVVIIAVQVAKESPGRNSEVAFGFGTGFVVNDHGDVVTNNHVVAPPGAHLVHGVVFDRLTAEQGLPFEVTWVSPERDLAFIHASGLQRRPLTLAIKEPRKGDKVWALGFPGAANLGTQAVQPVEFESTLTDGIVERVTRQPWRDGAIAIPIIQHGAFLNPGNSGGPLLNACGQVVGVNTGHASADIRRGEFPAGINYASGVTSLVEGLRQQGIPFIAAEKACAERTSAARHEPYALFGTAILALVALFFALRRPRQYLVNAVERVSRVYKEPPKPVPSVSSRELIGDREWVMAGFDRSGRSLRFVIARTRIQHESYGYVIGSESNSADLVVTDSSVSPCHARIFIADGALVLEDLGSESGSAVDGHVLKPFARVKLAPGSRVRLGYVEFRMSVS